MTSEQFGKTYLRYEKNIAKVLRTQKIYDEDLLHDTYIAVYELSQQEQIGDFVNTFVTFYRNLRKRQEKYDRIDEDDWKHREQMGQLVDEMMEFYRTHLLPGERNHERSCEILKLFRAGLSNVEIAKTLKIDESTVRRYIKRAILGFKSPSKMTTI